MDHGAGDRKSHWESREGGRVGGVYTLYEPDGALRRVEYTADAVHGFNAIVTREGQSKHHPPQVTPSYGPSSRSGEAYEPSSRAYIPEQRTPSSGYASDRSRAYIGSNVVDNAGYGGNALKDVGPKPY
ncbi:hypothetical protein JYU34_016807 [Plutella xylostella]|uniref:Cuticle protein n=1 Tax=Plutella xylostella TaxID=51655 RepID=A0ABQ7Q793_PLUXY|nr:hypothetical protein JYU34_016807 [Plutella xylostella]